MFSGKTEEIIRHVRRATIAGLECVVVKFAEDIRYGDGDALYTHGGASLPSSQNVRVVKATTLDDVKLTTEKVVAIDEGQFYPDLPEVVDRWMKEGRRIYIAALDGDYRRKPFGRVSELIPLCTHVIKLSGICTLCKVNNSSYTLRIVPGHTQKDIGAEDKYMSTCLSCYLEKA
jgi:thymidine kinase